MPGIMLSGLWKRDEQMTQLDDFVSDVLPRQIRADRAMHAGDAEPRMQLYSHREPVTIFGALETVAGWEAVSELFLRLASRFTGYDSWDLELVHAAVGGDVAYTVGYERSVFSMDGGPMQPSMLRVSHGYRREDGEWRISHRHGDKGPGAVEPLSSDRKRHG
jgi:ketosteroid isomerase-like protein